MNVWRFARHELTLLRRDRRAWAAIFCLFVLLVAAFVSSEQTRRAYERTRVDAQEASHRQWLTQGSKSAHSAAHFGVYAFRPLPPLAPFEPGLHRVLGTTTYLEAHKTHDLRDAPNKDGATIGYLDASAAYLARTVLPLLVFLLVAASIAGERERGTLEMLLAQGCTLSHIVLGKSLAFAVSIGGVVVVAAVIGVAVGAEGARVVGLAAGYLAFSWAAVFIAMTVSIGVRETRRAVVVLVALWGVGVLLGPRVVATLANQIAPMPTRIETQAALEAELGDSAAYLRRTDELRVRVLAEHGVTRPEELPFDFRGFALQTDEERGDVITTRHRSALRAHAARQEALMGAAAVLVPWLALEQSSTAFAGTDLHHADHFADVAEAYRRDLVARMNRHLMQTRDAPADEPLWSTLAPFTYVSPDTRFAFEHAAPSLAILFGWMVVSFGVMMWRARRAPAIAEVV